MKMSEFKAMTEDELQAFVKETKAKIYDASYQRKNDQLKDLSAVGKMRRDVARALTQLSSLQSQGADS